MQCICGSAAPIPAFRTHTTAVTGHRIPDSHACSTATPTGTSLTCAQLQPKPLSMVLGNQSKAQGGETYGNQVWSLCHVDCEPLIETYGNQVWSLCHVAIVSLSLLANNNWIHNIWLHSLLLNNGNACNLLQISSSYSWLQISSSYSWLQISSSFCWLLRNSSYSLLLDHSSSYSLLHDRNSACTWLHRS